MIKSRPVTSIAAQNRVGHTGPPARRPPDALPTDRPTPHRGPVIRPPVEQGSCCRPIIMRRTYYYYL